MDLFYDLSSNRLTVQAGGGGTLRTLEHKRGDSVPLALRTYRGTAPEALSGTVLIRFGLKATLDGDLLAQADTWTEADDVYSAVLNLNTAELLAAIADELLLNVLAEITISEDNGTTWVSSQTVTFTVRNDVLKEEDGTPEELPGPDAYVAARAVLHDRAQTLTGAKKAQVLSNVGAAAAADVRQLRYRSCATRMDVLSGATVNATGAVQTITSSFTVKLTDAVRNMRILITLGTGAVNHTVQAAAVIGSTNFPLCFNGSRNALVSANGMLLSDPLGPLFAKGTSVVIRVWADAGSGNVVQYNQFTNGNGGYWASANNVDAASPGGFTGTLANILNATMVIGQCENPCLAILGDSIAYGASVDNAGWPIIAFGNNTANTPHAGLNANLLRLSKSGTRALDWVGTEYKKQALLQYADVALVCLGTNDITTGQTAAQLIATLGTLYADLAARGLRVWGSTLLPISSSTDGWVTTGNQTVSDTGRIATVNDWIRTLPSPLIGYVEASDVASSARNSGIWKAGYTVDGLHPRTDTQTAREAIAAAVPSDILTRR